MAVENLVVIDYRISIPCAFAPIPNSVPPMIAKVVSIAGRGADEAIDPASTGTVFNIGVDDHRKVVAYGESTNPSGTRSGH
jgi:hypothetical protein